MYFMGLTLVAMAHMMTSGGDGWLGHASRQGSMPRWHHANKRSVQSSMVFAIASRVARLCYAAGISTEDGQGGMTMTEDQIADAIIARLHRCAVSTRDAATDITTFTRTDADWHEHQHAEEFIAAATRHADTKAWLVAARSTSVDEHAARSCQRIDACVTIAGAPDEASAARLCWSVKRWAPNADTREA